MKLTLKHTLTFTLEAMPRAVAHLLLTPSTTPQQRIERWSVDMPGFPEAAAFRDGFGNRAHLVSLLKPEAQLTIAITGVVETADKAGVLGRIDHDPPPALFRRLLNAGAPPEALIAGLVERTDRIAVLHELMERTSQMPAAPAQTQSQSQSQSGDEDDATQSQSGTEEPALSTVDAFVVAGRHLGIPTRYVTGYLYEADEPHRHAWAEAWDDRLGWIGFDPALNLCPIDSHIRLASGLDAGSTVPIRTVPSFTDTLVETLEISAG